MMSRTTIPTFTMIRSRDNTVVVEGPAEQKQMPLRRHWWGPRELASGSVCSLDLILGYLY